MAAWLVEQGHQVRVVIHLLPQRAGERLAGSVRRGGAARAAHAVFRGAAAARPRPRHPLPNGRVRPPLRRNPSPRRRRAGPVCHAVGAVVAT